MIANKLSHIKKAAAGLLTASLLLPLGGCDVIIINDVYKNNVSNSDVEKNNSPDSPFTPTEYTPYKQDEGKKALSERYLAELPERDYNGAVFFITTPAAEHIDPEDTDNNVTRMFHERNRDIEKKYDITLLTSVKDGSTILTEMEQAIASDSYYSDLLMTPLYMTGQYRIAGVLMNLRSMPFLDLDAPYFNSESVNMTSAGNITYGVSGHASLAPSAFSAVFFNRDIFESAGLSLPYADVMAKEWTWERFFAYTDAAADINDGGDITIHTLGVQSNASRLADLVFISSGNRYVNAAKKTIPKIAFTAESAAGAVETAHRLLNDPNAVIDASSNAVEQFANGDGISEGGNTMFLIDSLTALHTLTDSRANWGVLPLPMEKEGSDYRTLVANTELIFTVPANHTNPEIASVVLSALNAGSYGYMYDEYVAYHLANTLRDNDSANMLELIFDTAAFDFALAFGNSYPGVAAGTYGLIRETAVENNLKERFFDAEGAVMKDMIREFPLK